AGSPFPEQRVHAASAPLSGGIDRLLRNVGGALEQDMVAVGVAQLGNPHRITDEGGLGVEPAAADLVVDRHRIAAGETEADAGTDRSRGKISVRSLGPEFLQHQRGIAEREPAPAKLAVIDPLMLHGEPQAIDVETMGPLDVVNPEEGND